jgi:hypothetical protein
MSKKTHGDPILALHEYAGFELENRVAFREKRPKTWQAKNTKKSPIPGLITRQHSDQLNSYSPVRLIDPLKERAISSPDSSILTIMSAGVATAKPSTKPIIAHFIFIINSPSVVTGFHLIDVRSL